MSYCDTIKAMPEGSRKELHQRYHDYFYGFPLHDDNELFGRLVMEINQAGLSWETILKKEEAFRKAYHNFDISTVANFCEADINRLLNDSTIIRNKLKINAVIANARTIINIQNEFGSFENWLNYHHPKDKEAWVKLFKKTFKFTGGEIVGEFLMSTGYLPGAHDDKCEIQAIIEKSQPKHLNKA